MAAEHVIRDHVLNSLAEMETSSDPVVVYVIVALCDNEHQGIVPVASQLGDGDDPGSNLYWGAQYGIKSFLTNSPHWNLQDEHHDISEYVVERCVFTHTDHNAILIADAYRGSYIKESTNRFLEVLAERDRETEKPLLVAYVGHNGLMDFDLASYPFPDTTHEEKDVIILACASKYYFSDVIKPYQVYPLLWTTALCAPEAYTLEASLEAWLDQRNTGVILDDAAGAYARFQKCSIKAAKRIFTTGW